MNQEIKGRWVGALRSGTYQQGRLVMQNPAGQFCCLGVLCDLYAQEKGQAWGEIDNDGGEDGRSFLGFVNFPAAEVLAWAGLQAFNPSVEVPALGRKIQLAELNDGWGRHAPSTFEAIADLIEAQL